MIKKNLVLFARNKITKFPNWVNRVLLKLNNKPSLIYGNQYWDNYKKLQIGSSLNKSYETQLFNIVNFAIKNIPYYIERYKNLEIKTINDFQSNIDFIDRDIVMNNHEKFINNDY